MAIYVLIHGAASDSWYWHLVAPELQARGHDVLVFGVNESVEVAGRPQEWQK